LDTCSAPAIAAKNQGRACTGDPCNAGTGVNVQRLLLYSSGILKLELVYNSGPVGSPIPYIVFPAGNNWSLNYSARISGLTTARIAATRPDGRMLEFQPPVTGNTYVSDPDVADRVTRTVDAQNNPTGWSYWNADTQQTEQYDTEGKLLSIQERTGQTTTLTYSDANTPIAQAPIPGLLIGATDSFGHTISLTYNIYQRIVGITDPSGGQYTLGYSPTEVTFPFNLTSVTFPDTQTRVFLYNEQIHTSNTDLPNTLTGITDEGNSRFATFDYDSQGRVVSSQHAGGAEQYTFSYTTPYQQSVVTDPLGTVRTYAFTVVQGMVKATGISQACADCEIGAAATYDANGNFASRTDFNGNLTTYGYDLTRNLETSRTEASGTARARTITTQWHATYHLPTLISVYAGSNATGTPLRTTSFTYDSAGNQLTRTLTDPATSTSRTWTYTYDGYGRVLTAKGPRTDVDTTTTYTYYTCTTGSECGQEHTVTNALNQVTTYNTYNVYAQPLTITDPNGIVTTLTYDARQRLTSRQVGTETTSFTYWPTGLLKKVTLPDASYLLYTYDAAHRLTQISDGLGNAIDYTLDAMGNRTAENLYDPSNTLHRTHARVFNSLSQLYKDLNAAGTAAVTTTFVYDPNGNQTSIAAPLSRNTANAYDELNRLKQITDPANGITQFVYDANDNLISVIDPRTLTTSYAYNGFGDLTTQTSPDTGTTTNTYDSAGNLATSTDARGAVSTYAYDALNRVTSVAYRQGGTTDQTIAFTYDAGTNGKGHLTGASDANHSMSWTYDALGRVTSKSQTVGAITRSVGYAYTNGNLTSLTTPSGQTVTYGYNGDHQVTSVTVNSTTVLNNATYEPLGPVSGWTWGNGTTTTRTYDTDGKISQIASAGTKTYGYDDAFRITGISDTSTGSANWTYGYDALDRITSGTSPSITRGWTYDANGNRLTEGGTAASTYSISPTNNRITAITGTLARTYGYDAAGNTTSYATVAATYNNAGRLQTLTQGSSTETAIFNAVGQRIQKSGGSAGTVLFWYDEAGHLLGEYDGTGALIEETVWLGDIPVATLRPNGSGVSIYYVHSDQLNTPRQVTRPSDNVQMWTWFSDPFGTDAANPNPAGVGTFTYNLRFPGQVFDGQAGLHENGFRDYDPAVGGYTTSDPIGLSGGINTYAFALSRPLMLSDALGLAVVKGATPDELALLIPLLNELESKIKQSLSCCNKDGKEDILSRFGAWVIERSNDSMPSTPEEDTMMSTNGRGNHTTYYSNTPIGFSVVAHEWSHTLPQNIRSAETPSGNMLMPWGQQPWEQEAEQIARRLSNGQSICDLLTGEALRPDPALEMYGPRPGLGELLWNSLKSLFH
jgi:RHS repeat-associated protein